MQALEPPREDGSAPAEHLTELKFSEFELAPEVQRGIADAGFTYCTPIQSKTLPIALAGRDAAGQAQTGTGKTAAYLIALFQHLLTREPLKSPEPGPRALILAPTRELAVQIHDDAALLGKHLPFRLGIAFGGTDYEKQKRHLSEGVDILIGTPGRLIDFFKQRVFSLKGVQVAVLDEADRMFDLGFLRDIRYILRRLPQAEQRLNLLFSATLSYRVLELAYEHMNDPELVRIEPDKLTVDRIRQKIYFPSNAEKLPLLISLLKKMDAKRTMVFVNTRREAEHLRNRLEQAGILAAALSGDVPQRKRLRMLRDFQAGELSVLIATDVASRGLHVPDVSHVFNYDLPQDPEDYVHRIGRTARAGATGDAISFGCEAYVVSLPEIEEYIGRRIPVDTFDPSELEELPPAPPRSRGKREARRQSGSGRRGDGRRGEQGHGAGRRTRRGSGNAAETEPGRVAEAALPEDAPPPSGDMSGPGDVERRATDSQASQAAPASAGDTATAAAPASTGDAPTGDPSPGSKPTRPRRRKRNSSKRSPAGESRPAAAAESGEAVDTPSEGDGSQSSPAPQKRKRRRRKRRTVQHDAGSGSSEQADASSARDAGDREGNDVDRGSADTAGNSSASGAGGSSDNDAD